MWDETFIIVGMLKPLRNQRCAVRVSIVEGYKITLLLFSGRSIMAFNGLSTATQMRDIMARPGYIGIPEGRQRLRDLYAAGITLAPSCPFWLTLRLRLEIRSLDLSTLSHFGLAVFAGHLDLVKKMCKFALEALIGRL